MPEDGSLESLQDIREINRGFPYTAPIRAWKAEGKKVIAWQCTYVPEEIVWAAGILPVRMTGDSQELGLEEANAYLYINTCSFCRSCLELALRGEWDFLDGYVSAATCDGSRRLADVWRAYLSIPIVHVLTVPREMTQEAHRLYFEEVGELRRRVEETFKVEVTDAGLREAIALYNRGRQLLRELYELRKGDAPAISGAETLEVINAGFRMPRDQFNTILEQLLREARAGGRAIKGKARIMVTGSPLNNPGFLAAIEELGGLVVADELCMGTRYWWDPVQESVADPLEAIARRYLNNFPCARMVPCDERFKNVLALARDYRVDGVVSQIVRYCVPYAHDQPMLRERLEAEGMGVLELDVEYGMGGTGQIRTRVQAFIEMLLERR
ncbi:MAG: 2-hydroxyacyl-CoA dehydratase subunit D [Candidatus Methylomirabilia bacterium]